MNRRIRLQSAVTVLVLVSTMATALAQHAPGWTLDNFKDLLGRCLPHGDGQRCEAQAPPDGIFRGTFDAQGRWLEMTTFYGHAMTSNELDQFQGDLQGCEVREGEKFCVYLRPGQRVVLIRRTDSFMVKITPLSD